MSKTQVNQKKNDTFYDEKAKAVSGNTTRVETSTTVITKTDNLFAHVVATCNVTTTGIQKIDGYRVKDGDIVLLTNQILTVTQGLMKVNAAGAWTYTDDEIHSGLSCAIIHGKKYAGSVWVCQSPRKVINQTGTVASYWVTVGQCEVTAVSIWAKTRKLVSMLLEKVTDTINDRTYEVVARVDSLPVSWTAFNNQFTTIPFTNIVFNPADGSVLGGIFLAGRTGYYQINGRFFNTVLVAPPDQIWLAVAGSNGNVDLDSCTIGTGLLQMQGSDVIYLVKGVGAALGIRLANNGHNILFPTLAAPQMGGFFSIHYCGSNEAATY